LSPRIVGNSQANKHRKQGKEAKATIIIRNFVKVKARTHCSQLVAIVALISLKLVTFFSSKQHARASSRQKESSYRVTNYSWMQRGKNLAFHISDLVFLAFHISLRVLAPVIGRNGGASSDLSLILDLVAREMAF